MFGGQAADNVRHGSFSNPTGPPPPYESVITDAASHSLPGSTANAGGAGVMHNVPGIGRPNAGTAASNGNAGLQAADAGRADSHFEIVVADPVKQGEGVSAFVSYKVRQSGLCFEVFRLTHIQGSYMMCAGASSAGLAQHRRGCRFARHRHACRCPFDIYTHQAVSHSSLHGLILNTRK